MTIKQDIGSGYAISGDKSKVLALAAKLGIPEWQAEMVLASQTFADPANEAKCRDNPNKLMPAADPTKPSGSGWVDQRPLPQYPSKDWGKS